MNTFELKIDYPSLLKATLYHVLKKNNVEVTDFKVNCFTTKDEVDTDRLNKINTDLKPYAIELVECRNQVDLVQGIKEFINQSVFSSEIRKEKLSVLLAQNFGYSYSHLSSVFSSKTYISIEKYFILTRIERVKEMLLLGNSLGEIAHQLDFSSVQHLSKQFKDVTGLSTMEFLTILKSRSKIDGAYKST